MKAHPKKSNHRKFKSLILVLSEDETIMTAEYSDNDKIN